MIDNRTDNNLDCVIFYITTPAMAVAKRISCALVNEKLAACVSILPAVNSIFRWNGKVETAEENLLIGKTGANKIDAIKSRVAELHTYEVPEIIFTPIIDGYEPYINWINESIL